MGKELVFLKGKTGFQEGADLDVVTSEAPGVVQTVRLV